MGTKEYVEDCLHKISNFVCLRWLLDVKFYGGCGMLYPSAPFEQHGAIFCLLQVLLRLRARSRKETKLIDMEGEATCAASPIMSIEVWTLKISLAI
jgi:hypothetical protein